MNNSKINSDSPLYLQLRELIRSKIESGEYLPGTAIPSVGTLAETYGIHRLSVRSAVSALVGEGLLKPVQGKGIFVVGEKLLHNLNTAGGFHQNMQEQKTTLENRILVKCRRAAGAVCSAIFRCDPEDEIFHIRRLCGVDGDPISIQDICFPVHVLPNLMEIDLNVFSVEEIRDFYAVSPVRNEQTLAITRLDSITARLLGQDPKLGIMALSCISYDRDGKALDLSYTYTRGDKCNFSVSYQR